MAERGKIRLTVTKNGIRVVTQKIPGATTATVRVHIGAGTRHEPYGANGVAHLLEHMVFKGTKTHSAYAIVSKIEGKGGEINAETGSEDTAYYARILPHETGPTVSIMADFLQHSTFEPAQLKLEREVVIHEIKQYLDNPEEHVADLFRRQAFPRQKIGRFVLGAEKDVEALTRTDLKQYLSENYCGANTVVAGTGAIDHAELCEIVKEKFHRLPRHKRPRRGSANVGSGIYQKHRETEHMHLHMGFKAPGIHDEDYYAAQLLSFILGEGAISRFYQEVREKRGLTYGIPLSHNTYSDVGLFEISSETHPQDVKKLLSVVGRELTKVKERFSPRLLASAKEQMRGQIARSLEDGGEQTEEFATSLLSFGRIPTVDEKMGKYMKVTPEDIQAAANKIFSCPPAAVTLGPQLESVRKNPHANANKFTDLVA